MSSPTLIIGDGNWAVKSGSLLGYEYGELSGQFAPIPITGSRASIATYTDQSGLIVSASSGVLRVDYSTGTGSLLLEPQRTNLLVQSNTFSDASWVKSNTSVTANTTTSPDGSTNADTLSIGVDASAVRHRVYQAATLTIGTTYTGTYYLKANEHQWIQMVAVSGFSTGVWANFDLVNGTIGNTGGTDTTASIQNVGNGWYRCRVSGVATGTSSTGFEILTTNNTNSGRYPSYQSLTAENVCYIYCAQLEAGAFPSTYIPTTSTSVTRIADTFSRSNIYTDGVITSGGGTWFIAINNNLSVTNSTTDRGIFIGDTNTGIGNALSIRRLNPGRLQLTKVIAGSTGLLYTTTTDTANIVLKWNGTSVDVFENGVKVVSASSFTTTNMEFLSTRTGEETYQFIPQMKLYNQPLSDAECISLTTL